MSSFNNIQKIKYTSGHKEELISLLEYIFFKDDRTKRKYLVFKFKNNLSQLLFQFKFDIHQYDINNELIESTRIDYRSTVTKPNEVFVPNMKFRANPECETISFELVYAKFDQIIFENGVTKDNVLTMADYVDSRQKNVIKVNDETPRTKKDKKLKERKVKVRRSKRHKYPYVVRNITDKNKNKGVIVLNFLLSIGMLVGIGVSIFNFATHSETFLYDGYYCRFVNDNKDIEITGYEGKISSDFIIPGEINNCKIVSVGEGAFKGNQEIETLTFDSANISIRKNAFKDCTKLSSVTSSYYVKVDQNAFDNCLYLDSVNLPNSTISSYAFQDCNSMRMFHFGETNASSFGKIFGLENEKIKISVIIHHQTFLPAYFFEGVNSRIIDYSGYTK